MRIHMSGSEWFGSRPGGLNRYFESLFRALDEQPGTEVTATAFGDPVPGGQSWGPVAGGLPARVVRSRIRNRPPSGALVDRHFALYGPAVPVRSGQPFVLHFQGPWYAESLMSGSSGLAAGAKHVVEAIRYWRADQAVVLCEEFARILESDYRFPRERISVIPPGVDLRSFELRPLKSNDRPLVLCVRRLERRMGIDVLLDAWPAVLRSHPDARLGVVGDGSERSSLVAQADSLGISASVEFHGRVDDDSLAELYTEAACTVVPTRALEGFGLIALESLAIGRAPIVTRTGGLPDSVLGLDPSLIVEKEDPVALSDRLSDALSGKVPSPDQCRKHAETFAWPLIAGRHLDLYRSLAR